MTAAEFKAWLAGFNAGIGDDGAPTKKQWETVVEKTKEIDGVLAAPTTTPYTLPYVTYPNFETGKHYPTSFETTIMATDRDDRVS